MPDRTDTTPGDDLVVKYADWTPKRASRFLEKFRKTGNVTLAAKFAGVCRQSVYKWRCDYPVFARLMDEAREEAVDLLEQEAHRRAFKGTLKPVFHQGSRCGYVREYSNSLAMFLLRAHRPEKYRERAQLEHTTPDGQPLLVEKTVLVIPSNGREAPGVVSEPDPDLLQHIADGQDGPPDDDA